MRLANRAVLLVGLISVCTGYQPTALNSSAPDPQIQCSGYQASKVKTTSTQLTATLGLQGSACNVYGTDIQSLNLLVEYQAEGRLHVQIQPTYLSPMNSTQYLLNPEYVAKPSGSVSRSRSDLAFQWGNDPSFWFQVIRKSTKDVILDTKGHSLIFENQFVELKFNMQPDAHISGFGDQIHSLALEPGWMHTSWNADVADVVDANIYGTHQFWLETRYSSNGTDAMNHGVYMRNAHGSDAIYNMDQTLTWRFIGGIVDLYLFSGPSAQAVTQQYALAIGLPAMHQYWTLGFQQCAWGYRDWTEILNSIDNYTANGIPLEV